MGVEDDNDAAARADGWIVIVGENGVVYIGDGCVIDVIDVARDVAIDFDVTIALGVKIGFDDEKIDREGMVDVDAEAEVDAWVEVVLNVELAACVVAAGVRDSGVVTEIIVGVTSEGDPERGITVETDA